MSSIEIVSLWLSVFLYMFSFILHLTGKIFQRKKNFSWSGRILIIAFLFHTATAVIHWIITKHPPVTDTYELNLSGVWLMFFLYFIFVRWEKADRRISLFIVPVGFLVLGYGYLSGVKIIPMGPAFQSPWLIIHVIFAWLAFGSYAIATGAAFFLLSGNKNMEKFDMMNYRFIVLGFINHAIMLISGAIWAKKLWGHYWNWDPLETWSLISFLFYAFYLHTRSFLGWKMKKTAWVTIAGLIILAVSFWGVGLFGPTIHPGP